MGLLQNRPFHSNAEKAFLLAYTFMMYFFHVLPGNKHCFIEVPKYPMQFVEKENTAILYEL